MDGRGDRIRTRDLRFWRPLLYQLSYTPARCERDYTALAARGGVRSKWRPMRRSWIGAILPVFALALASGCKSGPEVVQIKHRPKAYKTVVSLSPNTTEIYSSVIGRSDLKGRTAADDWPSGSALSAPVVATVKPDYEKLTQIHPDLILYDASLYSQADLDKLKTVGADMFAFDKDDLKGFEDECYDLANLLGGSTQVSSYVDRISTELSTAQGAPPTPAPKVAVMMPDASGADMIAGTESFVANAVKLVGGQPVGPGGNKFVPLSPESLVSMNPDVIVVPGTREDYKGAVSLLNDKRFASVKAIQTKRVTIIEPGVLLRRGARVDKLINGLYRAIASQGGNS